ncbi:MAG: hypothetical protein R3C59_27290 [Planctomycetaceae bacterium]
MKRLFPVLLLALMVWFTQVRPVPVSSSRASDPTSPEGAAAIARRMLKPLNSLVGDWRGVGQLKRGSRVGAWVEQVSCAWDFQDAQPAVVLNGTDGQQFDSLRLSWDAKEQRVVMEQKTTGGLFVYTGEMPDEWPEKLVLQTMVDATGTTRRCTLQQRQDIRVTILFEQQTSPTGSFRRIAEIGYTRAGERLAVAGASQRKCIVTGGLGTIPVSHNGKTYYVCCQGCVQAFRDAPDAIIAEYQASLKAAQTQP